MLIDLLALGSLISAGSLWLAVNLVKRDPDNRGFLSPLIIGTGYTIFYAFARPTWYAHIFPRILFTLLLVKVFGLNLRQVFIAGLIMGLTHFGAWYLLVTLLA